MQRCGKTAARSVVRKSGGDRCSSADRFTLKMSRVQTGPLLMASASAARATSRSPLSSRATILSYVLFYCGILAPNSPCPRNSVSISSVKTTKPSSTTRSLPAWCASLPSRMSKSQPVRNSITSSSNTSSSNNSNNTTNSSSSSITSSNNSNSSNNNNRPNNIPLDNTPRSTVSTSAGRSSRSAHSVVPNSFLLPRDPWD